MSQPDTTPELHNTIQSATFVMADVNLRGHIFALADEQRAMVSFEEMDEQTSFDADQEVELLVESQDQDLWVASLRKAQKLRLWDSYVAQAKEGALIEGVIVGENSGGVTVDVGVRGFVPWSQLDLHRVEDASSYMGRTETFKILRFDEEKAELVLSRRKHLESLRADERDTMQDQLVEGAVFEGVVRNVKPYGAFVDIGGGIEGLLHVSHMTWGRLDSAAELMRPGDTVRVVVLEYNEEKKRLSLGRKQLLEDPWANVEFYNIGDVLAGRIVSLADFGAFVELAPGLEGLVHVSEISWTQRINKPSDVLELGQDLAVRVVDINREEKRLSLSIRQMEENPWERFEKTHAAGQRLVGTVRGITDFGAFVEVDEDIQGLVHVSNISWTANTIDPATVFTLGEDLDVIILDVDTENQRLDLGIKQLEDNPWDALEQSMAPGTKIKGVVSRVTDFGAFVTIAEGIEGLIHVSELAEERVEDVRRVVRPGQEVEPLVISFDRASERISLSLKRDSLDEGGPTDYDEGVDATSTLGDILRARLAGGAVAPQEEE